MSAPSGKGGNGGLPRPQPQLHPLAVSKASMTQGGDKGGEVYKGGKAGGNDGGKDGFVLGKGWLPRSQLWLHPWYERWDVWKGGKAVGNADGKDGGYKDGKGGGKGGKDGGDMAAGDDINGGYKGGKGGCKGGGTGGTDDKGGGKGGCKGGDKGGGKDDKGADDVWKGTPKGGGKGGYKGGGKINMDPDQTRCLMCKKVRALHVQGLHCAEGAVGRYPYRGDCGLCLAHKIEQLRTMTTVEIMQSEDEEDYDVWTDYVHGRYSTSALKVDYEALRHEHLNRMLQNVTKLRFRFNIPAHGPC